MNSVGAFHGRKAIVTGGSRGIGRAIAKMLLQEGASVAICGRTEQDVRQTVKELQAETAGNIVGAVCDVTKVQSIIQFFAFADDGLRNRTNGRSEEGSGPGALDILVNNAGVGVFRPVAEMTAEDWQQVIGTNLTAAFHCSRLAIERFRRNGKGFVVNISSLAGKNAFAGGAAYNASKAGLNAFSEALMLDHRNENIRVCSVMPGSVSTDFVGGKAEWKIQPEDVADVTRLVLSMPERTMVSAVEIRPSRPVKG